jgi:hypothetical protein
MAHPIVDQLRVARSEFVRSLEGVSGDGVQWVQPMNSIGWMVGHLVDQEQRVWLKFRGQPRLAPDLNAMVGNCKPASTLSLAEMWETWRTITSTVDSFWTR